MILEVVGLTLGLLGLVVVGVRFWSEAGQFRWDAWSPTKVGVFVLLASAYACANLLLVFAWHRLLTGEGVTVPWRWAVRTYGLTQVAKYLPGNIFHFAGRQAIGMADGIPGWSLARASAWELGAVVLAGLLLALASASIVLLDRPALAFLGGVLLFAATIAVLVLRWGVDKASALVSATSFLLVSAGLFIAVCFLMAPETRLVEGFVTAAGGAYVLAWLAGVLTPGAPAGLGIREIVLLGLLDDLLGDSDIGLIILVARGITVAGDALLYVGVSLGPTNKSVETAGALDDPP